MCACDTIPLKISLTLTLSLFFPSLLLCPLENFQCVTGSYSTVTIPHENHASTSPSAVTTASPSQMTNANAINANAMAIRNKDMLLAGAAMLPPSLQNVETFGSFLGEEIVCNWRRGFELPASIANTMPGANAAAAAAAAAAAIQSMQQQSPQQQQSSTHTYRTNSAAVAAAAVAAESHRLTAHNNNNNSINCNAIKQMEQLAKNCNSSTLSNSLDDHANRQDDKSSHHDASSTASTPILQDTRYGDENQNGGMTPMSLPISKSPQEDNNNHLGSLPHGAGFPLGLPFHHQMPDRPHYRFSDDLSLTSGSMAGRLGDSLIPKSDPMEAKLQEMLRYNMDKYANQNLDTLHISRRVRELLSVHNIGQRLFAKYVLGLSQGTVSELLSKPKPWDKLTEKGRDSYRKMHAWACDDNAVLLLKSLIPKKGKSKLFFFCYCC